MERERLVLLTTKSILIIHFDFIRMVMNDFRRILHQTVNRIRIGDLVYPAVSLMPSVLFLCVYKCKLIYINFTENFLQFLYNFLCMLTFLKSFASCTQWKWRLSAHQIS